MMFEVQFSVVSAIPEPASATALFGLLALGATLTHRQKSASLLMTKRPSR